MAQSNNEHNIDEAKDTSDTEETEIPSILITSAQQHEGYGSVAQLKARE